MSPDRSEPPRPGCAGPRHRWGQAPRLSPRLPLPPGDARPPPASCCSGKGFLRLSFSGSLSTRSTSRGVEEERNGRERREGDALPRLLTFAWDFHRPADLSPPGSQASSRGEAKDSALLSSRDAGLLEPPERPQGLEGEVLTTGPLGKPPPARGPGTLIPSAQRLVWAAKQPLGNAALGALFA